MKAAIDIGTNSVRLLVAEVTEGKVKVKAQYLEETRLGEGITSGVLTADARHRTIAALEKFRRHLQPFSLNNVTVVATSAVRDAGNQQEFLTEVRDYLGWQVKVLSGEEEARLTFAGAVSVCPPDKGYPVVVDIGGGSTEIIYQNLGRLCCNSVNIGAVRTRGEELENIRDIILAAIDSMPAGHRRLIGVGGTATTVVAVYYGIACYTRTNVHGRVVTLSDIKAVKARLEALSPTDRGQIIGLSPRRADIIIPGLHILINVMDLLGAEEMTVSDAGLLDGILISY